MKKLLLGLTVALSLTVAHERTIAQNIGINTTGVAANATAMLDIDATNKGLLIPRMTLCQRTTNSCAGGLLNGTGQFNSGVAAQGLLVYQTDGTQGFYYNTSITTTPAWAFLSSGGGSGWLLTGNAGTVDGTNFLGTTDNIPLSFKIFGTQAGRIDHLLANVALGYQAGTTLNGTTARNTLIGHGAGFWVGTNNTTDNTLVGNGIFTLCSPGSFNTAVGSTAMYGVGGNSNTALGYQAMYGSASCVNGSNNIAIGVQSMYGNTWPAVSANDNIGLGYQTLYNLTSGANNTAIGSETMKGNTTGGNNTAIGYQSLSVSTNTGNNNTAVGYQTLWFNTSGNANTALGTLALATNSLGANNTAVGVSALGAAGNSNNIGIGYNAGDNITSGANNIILGYDIDAPVATNSNQLSIGNVIFGTGGFGTAATVGAGNIGIGMNAPASKLHSAGQIRTGIPSGGLGAAAATTGSILFYNSANAFTTSFQSGATSTAAYTLPVGYPAVNGYVLSSTTGGVMSWGAGATGTKILLYNCETTATGWNTTAPVSACMSYALPANTYAQIAVEADIAVLGNGLNSTKDFNIYYGAVLKKTVTMSLNAADSNGDSSAGTLSFSGVQAAAVTVQINTVAVVGSMNWYVYNMRVYGIK